MSLGDSGGVTRPSFGAQILRGLIWLLRQITLDRLCGLALLGFVVLGAALFYAAFCNHQYVLDWTVYTTLSHLRPNAVPSADDLAKLEAGAKAFEAARSQLLSTDAITFLVELMIVIVVTVAVKVFSGTEKKLKKAEANISESEARLDEADKKIRLAEQRLDEARQIYRQLASSIGATSASLSASTLAGMVDRNLDRLANELAITQSTEEGETICGVMDDWLKSLKDTLTDHHLVRVGIPRNAFNALCQGVGRIDSQLKTIDISLRKDLRDTQARIDEIVRAWLVSANSPEPHDVIKGAHRLRELASLAQKLSLVAEADAGALVSGLKPMFPKHEFDNFNILGAVIKQFQEQEIHLQNVLAHQSHLSRLQDTIKKCREALPEELYQHWEQFSRQLKGPKS